MSPTIDPFEVGRVSLTGAAERLQQIKNEAENLRMLANESSTPALTLDEYQTRALSTAKFPAEAASLYPLLGLVGEVGEVCEKVLAAVQSVPDTGSVLGQTFKHILESAARTGKMAETEKKRVRGDGGGVPLSEFDYQWLAGATKSVQSGRSDILKEAGDVTWYLAASVAGFGAKLAAVAQVNLDKLADRARRGVIKGSGDNR